MMTLEARAWSLIRQCADGIDGCELDAILGIASASREDMLARLRRRKFIRRGEALGSWIPVDSTLELPSPDFGGHRRRKVVGEFCLPISRAANDDQPCALVLPRQYSATRT